MSDSPTLPQKRSLLAEAAQRDLVAELLADKKSASTRRAYAKDLRDFFLTVADAEPDPNLVREFLTLDRHAAVSLVLKYKSIIVERKLAEATINRRLAAIKSLVNYAHRVGKCEWNLGDIRGEKVKPYRDTTGVSVAGFKQMLAVPDRATTKGKRDYALLRLLWENALRCGEIARANIGDFSADDRKLRIYGKGRGQQAELITLSPSAIAALETWLATYPSQRADDPLFCALDNARKGHRLSTTSIYRTVRAIADAAGIKKVISPHRIRHSAVTAALDSTGGNVRQVQKLSRHAKIETLMVYDDNRQDAQGELSQKLADLL